MSIQKNQDINTTANMPERNLQASMEHLKHGVYFSKPLGLPAAKSVLSPGADKTAEF